MVDKLKMVLSYSEFEMCVRIARIAYKNDVVITKLNLGSTTNKNVALKVLHVLGVIESHSCGCNGTKLIVLNKPLVSQLADITLQGEVRA